MQAARHTASAAILAATLLYASATPAVARPELSELTSVDELRARFEADAGTTRLVLLLSPT